MEYKVQELKKGIKLHMLNTDKFKTDLIAVFLTTKLERKNVTDNAVISSVLRRGSKSMPTQEEISKQLEEMYGASFDCGLDKTGDNQVFKFYIETINDNFLPNQSGKLLKNSLEKIFDIVFNPYLENNIFKNEYVEQEKNNIKKLIEAKVDNKARYAMERCIEEMYKGEAFGLYKFGYIEDLEKIDANSLYESYKNIINNCKIDIFVSGSINNKISKIVCDDENIKKLIERKAQYVPGNLFGKKVLDKEKVIIEEMDVAQGKLVVGLDVDIVDEKFKYVASVYNCILGGSANSKMFQNVREKEQLAYVASSSFLKYKNNIFVNCGIEIENYEKALQLIKKQIEDMKKRDFTEEDLENAKKAIISSIKTIDDEQDTTVTYIFGQEISQNNICIDEYIKNISNVTKDEVIDIANKVSINSIYFLKGRSDS